MEDFDVLLSTHHSIMNDFSQNTQDSFGSNIMQDVLEPMATFLGGFCEYKDYEFNPKMTQADMKLEQIRSMVMIC